ncbi:MAG: hypothetical protein H6765_01455 [Candidatus Peribacteria bacterium]|nr:MAG: hypothetical protein H6765_01455 [Candidatus Peribacteria bacterium]
MTELSDRYMEVDPVLISKRARHIRDIRFKVYMFVCVVFIIFIWGMFIQALERVRGTGAFDFKNIFTMPVKQALFKQRGNDGLLNAIDALDTKIADAEKLIAKARVIEEVIKELDSPEKQYTLARCLNNGECNDISSNLLDNRDLLRAYIILSDLSAEKMDIDQKLLLQSINEFLVNPVGTEQAI